MNTDDKAPFWEQKSLAEMSLQEWESLCDGCGYCCLVKLQDEQSDELFITNVACQLLDLADCSCQDYAHRSQRVAACLQLTAQNLSQVNWLPETCAYRCLAEQRPLPDWHPLLTGQRQSVQQAGVAVCEFALPEEAIHPDQLEDHIIAQVSVPE